MKQKILNLIICLVTLTGAIKAQTIQNGSKWWDGSVLYTATVDSRGNVVMNGESAKAGWYRFALSKVLNQQGEYSLHTLYDDPMPLYGELGNRVQYIRQEGMYFLAVRNQAENITHTLTLTPDNLNSCIASERWAESQPVSEMLSNFLMNTTYLSKFSKSQLRLMRNEIMARHGYVFQSEDLRVYFTSQSWYKPGKDNNSIKLSIIEQANVQLIKSMEDYIPNSFPDGLDDDGRGLDEGNEPTDEAPFDGVIKVYSELEFLGSLANNTTIVIAENVQLNLSQVLNNPANFQHVYGRRWTDEALAGQGPDEEIISEGVSDGRQLTLRKFRNLTIRGDRNSSIIVEPRYAFCLRLLDCEECTIENLTIGHTEEGYCEGGVIGIEGGSMNVVKDCDLYGCGTYGFEIDGTNNLSVYSTIIRDCSYGILTMRHSQAVKFYNCHFTHNKQFTLIESIDCEGTVFSHCHIYGNNPQSKLFYFDQMFYLQGCEIYHPTENLGSMQQANQQGAKNWFSDEVYPENQSPQDIGPKM